ncbi:MAG: PEP-utilizing enzyme, partial [Microthrixaceae bacterium]
LRADRGDLSTYTDAELLERVREIRPVLHHLFTQHVVLGSSAAAAPGILGAVAEAIGDPSMPMKVLSALGDVDSALPSLALWKMSRDIRADEGLCGAFDAGIEGLLERLAADDSPASKKLLADWNDFLFEFGSRGPNEWDIHADSWESAPALALAALDRVRLQGDDESPGLRNDAAVAQRNEVTAEVRAKLADDEELAGMFEAALTASIMMSYRERTKSTIVRVIHEARMAFRELGRRHADAGDIGEQDHVFMLLNSELDDFVADPAAFASTLAHRSADYEKLWDIEPPFIISDGDLPPMTSWKRRTRAKHDGTLDGGSELAGVSGSPGVVRGTARVVLDPRNPAALEPGDILVAPHTDPSWTPLFMTAGGVVVDVGSPNSHAVIVSRELALPCVVSATGATTSIPDGAAVEVNGDTGVVKVLEST